MNHRLISVAALTAVTVMALQMQKHAVHSATSAGSPLAAPAEFTASTEKTFDQLMGDAISVMHKDMHAAPTGDADRDFVTMMIPHHQGAIDMAKTVLLYGRDEQIKRLAQEIIADQQNEIELMRLWLKRHGAAWQDRTPKPSSQAGGMTHDH